MKLEQTIQMMFDEHPSLFQYRWETLVHLFLTNGNGFDWHRGELVEPEFYKGKNGRHYTRLPKFSGTLGEDGKAVQRQEDTSIDELFAERKADGSWIDGVSDEIYRKMKEQYRHKENPELSDLHLSTHCFLYRQTMQDEKINPDWAAGMEEARQLLVEAGVPREIVYGENGLVSYEKRERLFEAINADHFWKKKGYEKEQLSHNWDDDTIAILSEIWNEV